MRRKIVSFTIGLGLIIGICGCGCGKSKNKSIEGLEDTQKEVQQDEDYYYDDYGERYSYGDSTMSAEDVIYAFVKSLSMLDFNSALKYVYSESNVINGFDEEKSAYNGGESGYGISYNFYHKIYKSTLRSLMIDSVEDTVIYEDGFNITVNIRHLDCNDNKFWESDKDEIFAQLLTYILEEEAQDAENKSTQYLASYIRDFYEKDDAPTAVNEVEFKLTKSPTGAWVIEDDSDLYALCIYNDGEYLIRYIRNEFNKWYEKYLEESN